MEKDYKNHPLIPEVISSAIKVHKTLGPGLLESAYEQCLAYEMTVQGISFERQLEVPVMYGAVRVDCGFRLDLFVGRQVVVELKSVESLAPIHNAQILTYMKLLNVPFGLLINFNAPLLKDGIRKFVL